MSRIDRLRLRHRVLRRAPGSVQVGLDPAAAAVLESLLPGDVAVLTALGRPRTLPELYAVAARHAVPARRVDRLVGLLRAQGLLAGAAVDRVALTAVSVGGPPALLRDARVAADTPQAPPGLVERVLRRPARCVAVDGRGELAALVAEALRRAGIGQVLLGMMVADDLDLSLRAAEPAWGGPRSASAVTPPAMVVLVGADAVDPRRAAPWWRRGIPHLPVVAEGARVTVGPLGGLWREGACLRCVDLYRSGADPGWPAVLAELTADPFGAPAPGTDTTLAVTAAGVVAMVTCGVLDGRAVPAGVALEVSVPYPRIDYRRWARHPACPEHTVHEDAWQRVTMAG